ncbi:MAG: methylmalonyl-CoA epimerase [bacterium]|nr:methylmalonyl-CoA epimerase [bacterium]
MIIDHIGIAVKSIEQGIEQWENVFGYKQMTEVVVNTRQKVKVVFLKKTDSMTIKLIQPTDESSPVYAFAQKGGGLHHLGFKCDNVSDEMRKLKDDGLRVLVRPQPGEAFDNEKIAFLFAHHGLNIELFDTDKRAKIIDE